MFDEDSDDDSDEEYDEGDDGDSDVAMSIPADTIVELVYEYYG